MSKEAHILLSNCLKLLKAPSGAHHFNVFFPSNFKVFLGISFPSLYFWPVWKNTVYTQVWDKQRNSCLCTCRAEWCKTKHGRLSGGSLVPAATSKYGAPLFSCPRSLCWQMDPPLWSHYVQEGEKDQVGLGFFWCKILTDWILNSELLVNKIKHWANLMQATRASQQALQWEREKGCSFSESLGAVFPSKEWPVLAVSRVFSVSYCLVYWQ